MRPSVSGFAPPLPRLLREARRAAREAAPLASTRSMALQMHRSFHAAFYLPLKERAVPDIEAEFFARTAEAEQARSVETAAATTLQAGWYALALGGAAMRRCWRTRKHFLWQ